jgi:hypothetical protein
MVKIMKGCVILRAYNGVSLVETKEIPLYNWYEGKVELIDNDEYRRINAISKIEGIQYDDDEKNIVYEKFVNEYDENGNLISSDIIKSN